MAGFNHRTRETLENWWAQAQVSRVADSGQRLTRNTADSDELYIHVYMAFNYIAYIYLLMFWSTFV